jgi:hypothetical protein
MNQWLLFRYKIRRRPSDLGKGTGDENPVVHEVQAGPNQEQCAGPVDVGNHPTQPPRYGAPKQRRTNRSDDEDATHSERVTYELS